MALHFGAIGELIEHMKTTFTAMQTAWVDGTRVLDTKWEHLRTILRSHGRHPSPRGELLTTLLSGVISEPLQQFFASHLSPQKVARLHKGADHACTTIESLYVDHYHIAMEGLLYRLSELRGLAMWRKYFLSIGLLHHSLQELVQSASSLMLKGEEFIRDVRASRVKFRALCTWLHGCASVASSVDSVPHQKSSTTMYDTETLLELLRPVRARGGWNNGMAGGGTPRFGQVYNDAIDNDVLSQKHVLKHFRLSPLDSNGTDVYNRRSASATSLGGRGATLGKVALASMHGTNHTTLYSASLAKQFQTLVNKVQLVVRQPSERISASFRPTVNAPVFGSVGTQDENTIAVAATAAAAHAATDSVMSVPNCMLALHVRTLAGDNQKTQQRVVAFSGREAGAEGTTDVNCVWVMKHQPRTESGGQNGQADRDEEEDEEEEDNTSSPRRRRKRGRNEPEEEASNANQDEIGADNVWSIGCVPLPIGHAVVAMDFYGGGEGEEWLVVLMSNLEGDSIVALLDDQHEHIQYSNIGIDLTLRLPSVVTLVQLASDTGLVKDPSLYEKVLVTSDIIANTKPSSLDVCASRGIITVCTGGHTLHLYAPDLDDDSEEEEEEEEEEEDE